MLRAHSFKDFLQKKEERMKSIAKFEGKLEEYNFIKNE